MAVAVKNTTEAGPSSLFDRVAVTSLVGVAYVVASLAIVFTLLPFLWENVLGLSATTFAGGTFLGVVMLAVLVLLVVLGTRLLGPRPAEGIRAGIFVGLVGLLLVLLVTRALSIRFEEYVYAYHWFGDSAALGGGILVGVVGLVLLGFFLRWFLRPRFEKTLVRFEQQGWFTATSYKPMQGQKVRRGTIVGILGLVGCGIYVMLTHGTLTRGARDWDLNVPFTGKVAITDKNEEGDAGKLLDDKFGPDRPYYSIRIVKAGASNFTPGAVVPRSDFEAELRKLKEENKAVPEGNPLPLMVDRFVLRDINDQLYYKDHVKVEYVGDSENPEIKKGAILDRKVFEAEVEKLKEADKTPPEASNPQQADGTVLYRTLRLLPSVQFTVPLLLLAVSLWLAWRVVNYPTFADFLIATEAELNKVSWTTRPRLIQDTIVVLVTVVLMAVFLFSMDVIWKTVLSWKPVGVLKIPEEKSRNVKEELKKY
jgi:preprotein translocase SecE subunit